METGKKVYDVHVFVCTKQRESPKTGCGDLKSFDLISQLKDEIKKKNLDKTIRINKSGCLDMCDKGPAIVIYPQAKWFYYVKSKDIPKILEEIEK